MQGIGRSTGDLCKMCSERRSWQQNAAKYEEELQWKNSDPSLIRTLLPRVVKHMCFLQDASPFPQETRHFPRSSLRSPHTHFRWVWLTLIPVRNLSALNRGFQAFNEAQSNPNRNAFRFNCMHTSKKPFRTVNDLGHSADEALAAKYLTPTNVLFNMIRDATRFIVFCTLLQFGRVSSKLQPGYLQNSIKRNNKEMPPGEPLEIELRLDLFDIGRVDEVQQTFQVDGRLEISWCVKLKSFCSRFQLKRT